VGPPIVATSTSLHYHFSFFNTVLQAFLTVYLSRRVVHVSEFKRLEERTHQPENIAYTSSSKRVRKN
jgi:hypothetical protein